MQIVLLLLSTIFLLNLSAQPVLKRFDHSGSAQGTTYSISYFHSMDVANSHSIDSLFQSIDSSLSIYKPYSIISEFNNSKKGSHIDIHLKNVVNTSIQTYQQTNGIFDITIKPLMDAWGLGMKKQTSLPDSSLINNILSCVGSDKLFIENNFLSKSDSCIKIDVNGIAQGYTVDVIALYLDSLGIEHYLIELGGEIKVKGRKQPSGEAFTVGIETPSDDLLNPTSIHKTIHLDSGAITTSGSYRKFIESGGKTITHIIDPRTGYSYNGNILSVSVFARDAMIADAFDNALLLLPLKESIQFVESRDDLAAYFIFRDSNGILNGYASSKFKKLLN